MPLSSLSLLLSFSLLLTFFLAPKIAHAQTPDWSTYGALLQAHVTPTTREGVELNWVNYSRWKTDKRWPPLVAQLENFSPQQLKTREERLAFYINAYNIMAIKVVLDHWPLDSIKDAGSFFRPIWKRTAGKIDQKSVSLDEIEHKILRHLEEPRIHFAIVCASISCPDLRREPFIARQLNRQLEAQAKTFLNNRQKGLYQRDNTLHISQIFSWFEEDFLKTGTLKQFLARYQTIPKNVDIEPDIDYNWQLNGE